MEKKDYGLNDLPPLRMAIPWGLQHVLAMFAANLAVALILCGGIGLSIQDSGFVVQGTLLSAGVSTIIQALGIGPVGSRLPIMMGSTFTFLGLGIAIGGNPNLGYAALLGAFLIGGVIEAFLGHFIIKVTKKFLTPIVTGSVVMAIGLSLFGVGIDYAAGEMGNPNYGSGTLLAVAAITLIIAVALCTFGKGFLQSASVFIALVIGFALAAVLNLVDLSPVHEMPWLALPQPFRWGVSFKIEAILPVLFLYFVSMIEFVGDTTGVAYNSAGRAPTMKEFQGGIMCDGLGSSLAAIFGAPPNVSFSQNVGLIALTGVKSRFVVAFGGAFIAVLSFSPKIAQLFTVIPKPVLGGVCIAMFGMIFVSGLKVIVMQKLTQRNSVIVATALCVGMGVHFVPEAVAFLPSIVQTLLSGVAGTALIALLLNIIIPKTAEDQEIIDDVQEFGATADVDTNTEP